MGIPVSGKNLFPSNIQGLPTWYEIRVNGSGHVARALDYDLMVAMNAETYARDIREVRAGGYVLYDSTWPLDPALARPDVTFLGIPLARLCTETFPDPRTRILMKNIAYTGTLAALVAIDLAVVEELLAETYAGKEKLRASNQRALRLGYDYAREHFSCPLPFHVERMDANGDKILIDGDTATALGCLYAGATVAAWYPITPATAVMDNFKQFCAKYRRDQGTGTSNYLIIQAEDELAAIGMVIGACWNGARAFTSTSGPGISLMNELLGLAYYAEIPAVVIDVQRVGPSTGMPTRTQQADILECAYASHGDTKHILLFPGNPAECFEFAVQAFDLAERFQTPVIMLSDLDIGMNDWVVPRLTWDDSYRPNRGRVLGAADLDKMAAFYRYADEDDKGVTPRTLPGVHPKGAFMTRGSGHDKFGGYTETPKDYQEVVDRLARKHKAAAQCVPAPIIQSSGDRRQAAVDRPLSPVAPLRAADAARVACGHGAGRLSPGIGVVTLGSCDPAVREALDLLAQRGVDASYMRVRGFPFDDSVEAFLDAHDVCFVVEQNRDAQLRSLLILETHVPQEKLRSVLAYGGFPLSARHVVDGIISQLEHVICRPSPSQALPIPASSATN
jgi:2-oxoglutarate ferredoxin oxidoreductase subunit alpha